MLLRGCLWRAVLRIGYCRVKDCDFDGLRSDHQKLFYLSQQNNSSFHVFAGHETGHAKRGEFAKQPRHPHERDSSLIIKRAFLLVCTYPFIIYPENRSLRSNSNQTLSAIAEGYEASRLEMRTAEWTHRGTDPRAASQLVRSYAWRAF